MAHPFTVFATPNTSPSNDVMDAPPKLFTILVDRLDLLKHFAKETAGWKLAALCVIKLPTAAAIIAFAYWQTHH